ncbi:MAG: glycosyltransferase family 2 protein [Candidatus Omnitrophica bacterium]|nr:glycosyltransferase family 2 protein [Candidatus Omnitrophota bacterium]
MKLSIVTPAHNEEDCIGQTICDIITVLNKEGIEYEIIVVNDNSTDNTIGIVADLMKTHSVIKLINRQKPSGFGRAIKDGLNQVTGDVVGIVMGDLSDDPRDIVKCFRKIEEGYDCVFGSRFMKGSVVKDYPPLKLFINRLANTFIQVLFLTRANDITNAFKFYRTKVIRKIQPIQALYFNITVELPLKAIARKFKFVQIPINWYGRKSGVSKLSVKEMGRKYLFTVLYAWLEKLLLKDEIRDR